MSEVQKTSTWCLKRLYLTDGINRMWDGMAVLHLRRFRKYFRVTTSHFFPLRVFFLLWSYLCCRADVGLMTFYFHYFLSIIVQCSHDFMTKSDFLIGYVEKTTKLRHFFTDTLYNAFRFNVLKEWRLNECMTTILINKELDDKNYEYGNPKAWIKQFQEFYAS